MERLIVTNHAIDRYIERVLNNQEVDRQKVSDTIISLVQPLYDIAKFNARYSLSNGYLAVIEDGIVVTIVNYKLDREDLKRYKDGKKKSSGKRDISKSLYNDYEDYIKGY